ncbi:MAG: UDP-N-acetylmuramoyl-L-alanine--D-glutamate ligase [Oscillospiraceae bacterium]|jgi:UDP-N-acetylmuramoylalanine--D-glutamate ligase|nr:UDP-N-acetylmuramoyl-L-alanine--D-glutamate ligase [Oscillospiraceae bacterium]MDD7041428.1 UDP-N-acetylmuramoyl-L-alanine--D-glutamate ligase [Oscillospiraceae bacterium]MDY2611748.1 UDP-N-acetylmuramoyl-L-alanine--D-glutamate ligase [Oscillospiraceae bacterium]
MNGWNATEFFRWVKGKKIAFIGVGVTNTDCIRLFAKKGAEVSVLDRKSREQLGALADEFEQSGIRLVLGDGYLDGLTGYDAVFRAPGMYFHHPALEKARQEGAVITSEMELFFRLCPCKTYAVTGSDGKTTTTTLIAEMLKASGKKVYKGGNIGRALLPVVEEVSSDDAAVVELSSFQLISMRQSPDVAVITNVAPNHLDVHRDMQEYIDSKKNLILHQDGFSRTVLNRDNAITRDMTGLVRGELLTFSRQEAPRFGAYLRQDGMLCMRCHGAETEILPMEQIQLPGLHNVENFLAAYSAVWGDVPVEIMARTAREFGGVEHRMELVRELGGVKWYNDSIGTSPTRTIAGLKAFGQKIILIAGGYDKKIPYEPLAPYLCEKVSHLILMGATGPKIQQALEACPDYDGQHPALHWAESMEQAVQTADGLAGSGDIVALSPASASFDLYPNFEKRGEHFKRLVAALKP